MLESEHSTEETPIACLLTGDKLAARGSEVHNLFDEAEQVSELDDGYAFRFSGSEATATSLLAFILEERRCCPFFTFELTFEPNDGHLWLRLRGSAAIKDFVASAWGEIIAAHA